MLALVLISSDPDLDKELRDALDGSPWSVERRGPDASLDEAPSPDVILVDGADPWAAAWRGDRAKPVLVILDEASSPEISELAKAGRFVERVPDAGVE